MVDRREEFGLDGTDILVFLNYPGDNRKFGPLGNFAVENFAVENFAVRKFCHKEILP